MNDRYNADDIIDWRVGRIASTGDFVRRVYYFDDWDRMSCINCGSNLGVTIETFDEQSYDVCLNCMTVVLMLPVFRDENRYESEPKMHLDYDNMAAWPTVSLIREYKHQQSVLSAEQSVYDAAVDDDESEEVAQMILRTEDVLSRLHAELVKRGEDVKHFDLANL